MALEHAGQSTSSYSRQYQVPVASQATQVHKQPKGIIVDASSRDLLRPPVLHLVAVGSLAVGLGGRVRGEAEVGLGVSKERSAA